MDSTGFYRDDNNLNGTTDHEYFDFTWYGHSESVLKIWALKDKITISNPRKFEIFAPPIWNASFLRNLIEVCCHFKSHGILWESLNLEIFDEDDDDFDPSQCDLVACFLYHVNSLRLFKKINLSVPELFRHEYEGMSMLENEFALSGILLNDRVEKIEVWYYAMTNADVRVLGTLLRTTKTLQQLNLTMVGANFNDRNLFPLIVDGLSANTTLKQVSIVLCENGVSDDVVSSMITTLAHHPSLEELILHNRDQSWTCDLEMTSQAIGTLLTTSNTLSVLAIQDHSNYDQPFHNEHILQGLNECRCPLKILDIDGFLRDSLDRILFLPHPTLERIAFQKYLCSNIPSEHLVRAARVNERRTKPIVLEIGRGIVATHYNLFKELLHNHPEIRLDIYLYQRPFYIENLTEKEKFKHVCDLNWFGRYLLDTSNNQGSMAVPLSLWSLVLAKPTSRPSVVFEFLKSQVLLDHIKIVPNAVTAKSTHKRSISVDNDGNGNAGEQHADEEPPRSKRCLRVSDDTRLESLERDVADMKGSINQILGILNSSAARKSQPPRSKR